MDSLRLRSSKFFTLFQRSVSECFWKISLPYLVFAQFLVSSFPFFCYQWLDAITTVSADCWLFQAPAGFPLGLHYFNVKTSHLNGAVCNTTPLHPRSLAQSPWSRLRWDLGPKALRSICCPWPGRNRHGCLCQLWVAALVSTSLRGRWLWALFLPFVVILHVVGRPYSK